MWGSRGPRFPAIARSMGELLATFRMLPTAGLELDDLWADPVALAARAARWVEEIPGLAATERTALAGLVGRVPALFAKRPVGTPPRRLRAGERADRRPVANRTARFRIGASGRSPLRRGLVGVGRELLVALGARSRLAGVLQGAGIDATDPELPDRVRSLQVLRVLELLVGETSLRPRFSASWPTGCAPRFAKHRHQERPIP